MFLLTNVVIIVFDALLVYISYFVVSSNVSLYMNIFIFLMSTFGYPLIINVIRYELRKMLPNFMLTIRDFMLATFAYFIIGITNYLGWGISTGKLYLPDSVTVYIFKLEVCSSIMFTFLFILISEIVIRMRK